jgi:hypothetical protein
MSAPSVYYWAPSIVGGLNNGIALNQGPIAVGDNLVLNANTPYGTFSYINTLTPNTSTSGVSSDIIRSISITSPDDNTGVTFVISGIGAPVDGSGNPIQIVGPITEQLVGPNNGTATSVNIYTIIYSITVTPTNPLLPVPATNTSVGYGPNGITDYKFIDYNRNSAIVYGVTYSLQFINTAGLTVNTYGSLNRPQLPNVYGTLDPFGQINGTNAGLINGAQIVFFPAFNFDANITANLYNANPFGYATFWANVSNTTTDSLYFTILQQGL